MTRPIPFRLHLLTLAVGLACSPLVMAQSATDPVNKKESETAAAAAAPASAASAAAPATPPVQRVEITGTRASLIKSLSAKKEAATVQDTISAIELGRFPDDNVADSLSHITGVSITRTAGGEGQKVSIRGLGPGYSITTFNNRILGTDGAGRDFAFDVLPSDIINGADVIKGAQAQIVEGSIGGLINLRSASPFDNPGEHGMFRLEGDRNLMSKLNGAKVSATWSNTFADERVGVLFGAVLARRKDRTDTAGNDGGWTRNPVIDDESWSWGNVWGGGSDEESGRQFMDFNGNGVFDADEQGIIAPGQFRYGSIIEEKKRVALSGKVEFRPTDDLKVTVDGIWTRLDSPQVGYQMSFYPQYTEGRWSNVKIDNGIVTSMTLANPDPEQRLNPELLNKTEFRVVDTALYGINAEWAATADLTLKGDLYRSTSKRTSGGKDTYAVLRMNQPNTSTISLTGQAIPTILTQFDDGRTLDTGVFGPSDFNTHYFGLAGDDVKDGITGFNLDGIYSMGQGYLDALKFGVGYYNRRKARDLRDNVFNGGENYYSGDNAINVGDLGGHVLTSPFTLPDFMGGVGGTFPHTFVGFDMAGYIAALQGYNGKPRPSGGVYDYADGGPVWNPLNSYRVTEKTVNGYLQADLNGPGWFADVGLRLVRTQTTSQAWDAHIVNLVKYSDWNYAVTYGEPESLAQNASYTYALPSANFTWRPTDEWQLRFSLAKTMARPSVDQLAPTNTTQSVTWGEFTQIWSGNADLKPYSAVQGDISLEWYFTPKSIMNVALYKKKIRNQITTEWLTEQDIGVPGYLFNVMRPINGDYANVHGIEVGFQHLWESGFGVRGQYTRNWSTSYVGGLERPLENIAPSTASAGVLYEKDAWSMSLTADHTDGYVTAINVLGNGFNEQSSSITWLTAQVAYSINDNLQVSLEGRNLLDAKERYTVNGNPMLTSGYYRYGRAFTLGVSYRF